MIGHCDNCDRRDVPGAPGVAGGAEGWFCHVCRGDEPDPFGELDVNGAVQRKADARLLAPKPQKACDVGLFSDDHLQTDLVDMARTKR